MNLQYMEVINDYQIVSWPHYVEALFTDHVVLCYIKGLCRSLPGICINTGRRKGKGLVVPCRYNYCCGPKIDPALIRDLAFIFVIMLFFLATNRDLVFIRDWP